MSSLLFLWLQYLVDDVWIRQPWSFECVFNFCRILLRKKKLWDQKLKACYMRKNIRWLKTCISKLLIYVLNRMTRFLKNRVKVKICLTHKSFLILRWKLFAWWIKKSRFAVRIWMISLVSILTFQSNLTRQEIQKSIVLSYFLLVIQFTLKNLS